MDGIYRSRSPKPGIYPAHKYSAELSIKFFITLAPGHRIRRQVYVSVPGLSYFQFIVTGQYILEYDYKDKNIHVCALK